MLLLLPRNLPLNDLSLWSRGHCPLHQRQCCGTQGNSMTWGDTPDPPLSFWQIPRRQVRCGNTGECSCFFAPDFPTPSPSQWPKSLSLYDFPPSQESGWQEEAGLQLSVCTGSPLPLEAEGTAQLPLSSPELLQGRGVQVVVETRLCFLLLFLW